ncbi:hypothetical protein RI129_010000 [Pyrocoelia pectoralis]|uniref:CRC domain-containing protein n=1 Tax=Pyrocoelia pectoralis TaxID=417401 RepID=A0AAN7ZJE7_9COLE
MKNMSVKKGQILEIQQSPCEAMFGCKAKVGLSTSNLPGEVVDSLVTDDDLENVEQQMEDAINAGTSSANELAAVAPELCHNKQEIRNKRLAAHASLQTQGAKMLKNSNAKLPPAKVGDNVRIRISDVDRGGDPRSVLAVVMHVEGAFYKLGTEHGVLKQLKSLRTVASSQSLTGGQGYTRSNCTTKSTKCSTNRCKCKNNKLLCNSKCHKSSSCCNKL